MTSLNAMYGQLDRRNRNLSSLKTKRNAKQLQVTNKQKRIHTIEQAMRRTQSQSTIRSKQSERERLCRNIIGLQKELGTIDKKIVAEEKEISRLQEKIHKEEMAQAKKRAQQLSQVRDETRYQNSKMEHRIKEAEKAGEQTTKIVMDLHKPVKKASVLFLAANPMDTDRLALDEEMRAIQQKIRSTEYRDALLLNSRWATRRDDLIEAFNETHPTILHFSGHGNETVIDLSDAQGFADPLSQEQLGKLLDAFSDTVRLAVFNACYSESHARVAVEHVDFAIGMSDSILDDAARIFAAQLYSSLGFGHTIKKAFDQACLGLTLANMEDEAAIPRLFSREGLAADQYVLIGKEKMQITNESGEDLTLRN